jgi:RNA polymerase sigma-70 factor (ECF subfamily)
MKDDGNIPDDDNRPDDNRYVSLCKKGDTDAFEELVRRHQKKMLNVAYRMLGNYEEACEVVQDAFVSAYRHIRHFEGRSGFSTWLCSIVMNLSRNRLKQMNTRLRLEPLSLDDPVSAEDGSMRFEPASDRPTALENLEKRDLQARVQQCIGNLDADFRSVLVLRDIQGFSYDEIGKTLKITAGTVKSRLFRAREAVRDCLKKALGRL